MKISLFNTIIGLLICLFSSSIFAENLFLGSPNAETVKDCEEECAGQWTSSIELGYVAVSGNTETSTFNGRFALSYELEKWRHAGFIATQTSSSEDSNNVKTDAEKLTAQVKSDYQYSESAYAFGIVDYDDTKNSGFDYQASYAFGAGYRFIKNEKHSLDGELGIGSRQSKIELTGVSNQESISRLAGLYKWQISKNSNFEQKLSTEVGDDNTVSKSYSGLSANIIENLALKVSYTVKHQSDVPEGNEERETVTSFTAVYTF